MPKLKRINNVEVTAVPSLTEVDNRPVKGSALFPELYANIFLCARKKSGKTSTIYKLIKECSGSDTTVIAFVSTLYKDANWAVIQKYCETHHIAFEGYTSIIENEVNHLQNFIKVHEKPPEALESEVACQKSCVRFDSEQSETEEKKKKKSKYRSPEYIFIFDDLSNELKTPALTALLKKNRHFKCKVVVSSQYLNDLPPQSRKQMDNLLIFRGQPQKKLEEIYRDFDIAVEPELFYQLYDYATLEKYSFLYIDRFNDTFRRNFKDEFQIT